jgi:signal transduction histidine kinase
MASNYRSSILRLNNRNRGLKAVPPIPILADASATSGKSVIAGKLPRRLQVPLSWTPYHQDDRDTNERALKLLVGELARAREQERQRIANDLHDNIAQNLALAVMKLAMLENSVPREHLRMIQEVHQLVSEVIDETRSLVCDLYPHVLRDLGLAGALDWLVEHTATRYGLYCVADITSVPEGLRQDVQETLFQALRELLVNVAKHAQAKEARVFCRCEKDRLLAQVVDDGEGFDPERLARRDPKSGGFGLFNIRERLALLNGSLQIDSAPGKGTKVAITLPLNTIR